MVSRSRGGPGLPLDHARERQVEDGRVDHEPTKHPGALFLVLSAACAAAMAPATQRTAGAERCGYRRARRRGRDPPVRMGRARPVTACASLRAPPDRARDVPVIVSHRALVRRNVSVFGIPAGRASPRRRGLGLTRRPGLRGRTSPPERAARNPHLLDLLRRIRHPEADVVCGDLRTFGLLTATPTVAPTASISPAAAARCSGRSIEASTRDWRRADGLFLRPRRPADRGRGLHRRLPNRAARRPSRRSRPPTSCRRASSPVQAPPPHRGTAACPWPLSSSPTACSSAFLHRGGPLRPAGDGSRYVRVLQRRLERPGNLPRRYDR